MTVKPVGTFVKVPLVQVATCGSSYGQWPRGEPGVVPDELSGPRRMQPTMTRTPIHALVFALAVSAAACGSASDSSLPPGAPTGVGTQAVTADTATTARAAGGPAAAVGSGRAALPTIAGVAVGNADFSTLVAALVKADLVATFDGAVHYTVFAPTNAAFDRAAKAFGLASGPALVDALDVPTLVSVLTYHVTPGDRNATSVVAAGSLRMLDGNTATVTVASGGARIENAAILATDIRASNGLVHVIDEVLLPPALRP
jgi:uncharacterized surface protein with fasciclin (FAS1) repeats